MHEIGLYEAFWQAHQHSQQQVRWFDLDQDSYQLFVTIFCIVWNRSLSYQDAHNGVQTQSSEFRTSEILESDTDSLRQTQSHLYIIYDAASFLYYLEMLCIKK